MKKLTTEEFIEKARKIHGDKYNYSLVEYKSTKTKVKIICKEHGIFKQRPDSHISGQSCPKCGGTKKLTTDEFIEKSKKIHGNKYDYNLVEYKNNTTKVKIICSQHGIFEQKPQEHLRGCGCNIHNKIKKLTTDEFVEKARKKFGNKFDYSLVNYNERVKIICPIHGIFEQTPKNHLRSSYGCLRCSKLSNTPDFIKKARKIHGNRYDYSLVEYVSVKTKVKIICPVHGIFEQFPCNHTHKINPAKCFKCFGKIKLTTDDFIKKSKEIHGDKYDYNLVDYKNNHTKVKIICPEHGIF